MASPREQKLAEIKDAIVRQELSDYLHVNASDALDHEFATLELKNPQPDCSTISLESKDLKIVQDEISGVHTLIEQMRKSNLSDFLSVPTELNVARRIYLCAIIQNEFKDTKYFDEDTKELKAILLAADKDPDEKSRSKDANLLESLLKSLFARLPNELDQVRKEFRDILLELKAVPKTPASSEADPSTPAPSKEDLKTLAALFGKQGIIQTLKRLKPDDREYKPSTDIVNRLFFEHQLRRFKADEGQEGRKGRKQYLLDKKNNSKIEQLKQALASRDVTSPYDAAVAFDKIFKVADVKVEQKDKAEEKKAVYDSPFAAAVFDEINVADVIVELKDETELKDEVEKKAAEDKAAIEKADYDAYIKLKGEKLPANTDRYALAKHEAKFTTYYERSPLFSTITQKELILWTQNKLLYAADEDPERKGDLNKDIKKNELDELKRCFENPAFVSRLAFGGDLEKGEASHITNGRHFVLSLFAAGPAYDEKFDRAKRIKETKVTTDAEIEATIDAKLESALKDKEYAKAASLKTAFVASKIALFARLFGDIELLDEKANPSAKFEEKLDTFRWGVEKILKIQWKEYQQSLQDAIDAHKKVLSNPATLEKDKNLRDIYSQKPYADLWKNVQCIFSPQVKLFDWIKHEDLVRFFIANSNFLKTILASGKNSNTPAAQLAQLIKKALFGEHQEKLFLVVDQLNAQLTPKWLETNSGKEILQVLKDQFDELKQNMIGDELKSGDELKGGSKQKLGDWRELQKYFKKRIDSTDDMLKDIYKPPLEDIYKQPYEHTREKYDFILSSAGLPELFARQNVIQPSTGLPDWITQADLINWLIIYPEYTKSLTTKPPHYAEGLLDRLFADPTKSVDERIAAAKDKIEASLPAESLFAKSKRGQLILGTFAELAAEYKTLEAERLVEPKWRAHQKHLVNSLDQLKRNLETLEAKNELINFDTNFKTTYPEIDSILSSPRKKLPKWIHDTDLVMMLIFHPTAMGNVLSQPGNKVIRDALFGPKFEKVASVREKISKMLNDSWIGGEINRLLSFYEKEARLAPAKEHAQRLQEEADRKAKQQQEEEQKRQAVEAEARKRAEEAEKMRQESQRQIEEQERKAAEEKRQADEAEQIKLAQHAQTTATKIANDLRVQATSSRFAFYTHQNLPKNMRAMMKLDSQPLAESNTVKVSDGVYRKHFTREQIDMMKSVQDALRSGAPDLTGGYQPKQGDPLKPGEAAIYLVNDKKDEKSAPAGPDFQNAGAFIESREQDRVDIYVDRLPASLRVDCILFEAAKACGINSTLNDWKEFINIKNNCADSLDPTHKEIQAFLKQNKFKVDAQGLVDKTNALWSALDNAAWQVLPPIDVNLHKFAEKHNIKSTLKIWEEFKVAIQDRIPTSYDIDKFLKDKFNSIVKEDREKLAVILANEIVVPSTKYLQFADEQIKAYMEAAHIDATAKSMTPMFIRPNKNPQMARCYLLLAMARGLPYVNETNLELPSDEAVAYVRGLIQEKKLEQTVSADVSQELAAWKERAKNLRDPSDQDALIEYYERVSKGIQLNPKEQEHFDKLSAATATRLGLKNSND